MNYSIMVICEHEEGKILPVTKELISCAHKLTNYYPGKITAVLPTSLTDKDKPSLAGTDLLIINSPNLTNYSGEGWVKAVLIAAEAIKPNIIIIAHTSTGYDYAPRLAAHLDGSCITSVSEIEEKDGVIGYRRSGFHGKHDLLYEAGNSPLVITLLPGAFPAYEATKNDNLQNTLQIIEAQINLTNTKNIQFSTSKATNTQLADAKVIVAAGGGIGKAENLDLIYSLASCFDRSAIAGSRVACDNDWIEHKAQIGITGQSVSPQLYIACGISGTIQHLVGIKGAKTVVAINKDPHAAIFNYADICIVEDLEEFIPIFIKTHP